MRDRVTWLESAEDQLLAEELAASGSLPFAAPRSWLSLASEPYETARRDERGIPVDPLLAQTLPSRAEFARTDTESPDPLGETGHSPFPRLVHQYPSRILLRTTGECPMFCRHCFRRSLLPAERGFMSPDQIEATRIYLGSHPEVREVLVSGGDPLTAENSRLEKLFSALRAGRPGIFIRLCTRAPITLPSRVDDRLVELLARFRPLHVVIQCNHPSELGVEATEALGRILRTGIPLRGQTVLLAGVNDSAETLETLFSMLVRLGVDPYYLFQGDLAAGTSHFRVPLSRGLALYAELRKRLSGLELPRYAVDTPGGGGKSYLPEAIRGREGNEWIIEAPDGSLRRYPEEPPR